MACPLDWYLPRPNLCDSSMVRHSAPKTFTSGFHEPHPSLIQCDLGIFLDTYVSNAPPLVRTNEQLREFLSRRFHLVSWDRYRKAQIVRIYIVTEKLK